MLIRGIKMQHHQAMIETNKPSVKISTQTNYQSVRWHFTRQKSYRRDQIKKRKMTTEDSASHLVLSSCALCCFSRWRCLFWQVLSPTARRWGVGREPGWGAGQLAKERVARSALYRPARKPLLALKRKAWNRFFAALTLKVSQAAKRIFPKRAMSVRAEELSTDILTNQT